MNNWGKREPKKITLLGSECLYKACKAAAKPELYTGNLRRY